MASRTKLFKKYKKNHRLWIETGTYLGEGVRAAAEAGFEKMHTFEISEKYVADLLKQPDIQKYIQQNRLVVEHKSTASQYFRDFVAGLKEPSLFWLDAHLMSSRGKEKDYPLSQELDALASVTEDHTVLIDDSRLFDRYGVNPDYILDLFKSRNENYVMTSETVRDDLPNDVMVLRPRNKGETNAESK